MKQNDLEPTLRATLVDDAADDPTVDLTTAQAVRVIITTLDKSTEIVDRTCTIDDAPAGIVSMEWQTGDTTLVGRFFVEFEVMWADNRPQTFPVRRYAWLVIEDDLG
jgi:hypothetical protein